ncbi:mitochondrial K+-H+ exchange-related-domain-containing protein [Apodospora peruviana]|uniref:Mitochondrial K+-H+ exchange-related-domain-containing protein n=1 Tax=Apodospora peruviana TaxID=516989 RepID=A0AAE0I6B5_9PEZI|nr:mitochondrial K+-H+ exchange-related-domain-containing protein [Apodospora peruviana]
MRLYLLPISTRRTLLYCQKLNAATTEQTTWADRIQSKVIRTWADWEKKDKGWQKKVVSYGNYAFRRIPYEEWGLKSVPPLSQRRKQVELNGTDMVEVVYPKSMLAMDKVPKVLQTLATEREALHRKRLIWCVVGMPITAPVALIPVVPNIPFFYLVYRAWSHWRALSGGKHIQFLIQKNLLTLTPSPVVDEVYAHQKFPLPSTPEATTGPQADEIGNLDSSPNIKKRYPEGETMVLSQANALKMTRALDLPELEVELERAIWQVENAVKKSNAELAEDNTKAQAAKPASSETTTTTQQKDKKVQ